MIKSIKERFDSDYVIDRRGKIIKFLDICNLSDYIDNIYDIDKISNSTICSIHNEIATKILENKGITSTHSTDTLRKLGYIFIGGFTEHYEMLKPPTQAQINTLAKIGKLHLL